MFCACVTDPVVIDGVCHVCKRPKRPPPAAGPWGPRPTDELVVELDPELIAGAPDYPSFGAGDE